MTQFRISFQKINFVWWWTWMKMNENETTNIIIIIGTHWEKKQNWAKPINHHRFFFKLISWCVASVLMFFFLRLSNVYWCLFVFCACVCLCVCVCSSFFLNWIFFSIYLTTYQFIQFFDIDNRICMNNLDLIE